MKERFLPVIVNRAEAWCLRIFLVLAVLYSLWDPSKYTRTEDPAGLAAWGLPVAWVGQPGVHPWLLLGTAVAGLVYVLGLWRPGWLTFGGLLGMTFAHVSYWTLANSQGNTFHGSQMTSLVLIAQLAGWGIMWWRERKGIASTKLWPQLDGILLYFSQGAIASVYVTSAITKLLKSHGTWLWDSPYFAKSVQKVWRQKHFDNPSKGEFDGVSPWAAYLAEHPWSARMLFAPGFFLEMLAFMLVFNRVWSAGFGLALVLMHVGIGFIMQLYFPEFEILVFIFCVNVPYWITRLRRDSGGQLPAANS
jgi:hypothetical protein